MVVRFRGTGRKALLLAALLAACGEDGKEEPGQQQPVAGDPVVDLRVDANRSGALELDAADEDDGEDEWSATSGAVFLANLDDDDDDGVPDSADEKLNGEADRKDLAPIAVRAWPNAPDGTTAVLELDEKGGQNARLFRVDGDSYVAVQAPVQLSAADLRAGVSLAVEGKSLVTSTAADAWNGTVELTLRASDAKGNELGTDAAKLRVAPLMLQYNTAPTEAVYYSEGGTWTRLIAAGIRETAAPSGLTPTGLDLPGTSNDWDPWTQDFFDVGYTSMPGPGGTPIGMKIAIRSAQPDRVAGGIVDSYFAGPDWGSVYIYTPHRLAEHGYSMNSFGNWEVVPPHSGPEGDFPLGRNVWGSGPVDAEQPDPAFADFYRAQRVQPEINVDTSWLVVGHTDEVFSWVKSDAQRGWTMLVANPTEARQMLLDLQTAGHGDAVLFTGKSWIDWNFGTEYSAEVTVDEVLADEERMAASQEAQVRTDEMLDVMESAVGLADEEVIRIPFLYESMTGYGLVAYQPGTVNMLHIDGSVLVPKPFGPAVDGTDVFEADLQSRLGGLGLDVHFVDNWDLYHRNLGEVHCGSNVSRRMDMRWWETGR